MDHHATTLPVINSCDGCGVCCLVVTSPPYYMVFEEFGEAAWDQLRRERPDLLAEIQADLHARQENGGPFYDTPCLWYDPQTKGCRHYEYRPLACREFEVGGDDCLDARRRGGVV